MDNSNECIKKRIESGKTKEEATKACMIEKGSDIEEHEPSPVKKDTKEIGPVVKAWEFNPSEIMNSARKVTGTFHVPKIDKDNEIITKAAMGEAIPDFMHLPILHDFHKERVLGVVTKVWEEADAFHFNALFKATNDVDDAWAKVQKGEYDHVSIFGARLKGNTSCGLNPSQRSVPCISEKIRLDSISACDTNARNDSTSLGLAKAFYTDEFDIIKALSSDSGLSHGIYDGGRKSDMKVHEADGDDVEDDEDEEKKAEEKTKFLPDDHPDVKRAKKVIADSGIDKEEKKAEGSPAVREDIEAKKKDFAARRAGEKRSEGEDFHGGKLEKGDCGCEKGSLQKAKDGLKKIYGMLKTLTQHDKEMVAKDKEVHASMEKAGEGEDEEKAFVNPHSKTRRNQEYPERKWATHERATDTHIKQEERRFKKGAIRPKNGVKTPVSDKEDAVTKGEEVDKAHVGENFKRYGEKNSDLSRSEGIANTNRFSHPNPKRTPQDVKKGDNMTDVTEEIQKANLEVEMTDEQFVTEIVKANLKSTDEIVKAAVEAQVKAEVGEIRKAMETQFAELKAQLTKIEEQPMVKAAIIVPEDGKVDMPLNYAAVANFMKRG